MPDHIRTEPWASVDDVATHLGVARDSIYRWIDVKGLPAHKIGKLWKFKLSEVDAWVRGGSASDVNGPMTARPRARRSKGTP